MNGRWPQGPPLFPMNFSFTVGLFRDGGVDAGGCGGTSWSTRSSPSPTTPQSSRSSSTS